jgi:hypothetical protein
VIQHYILNESGAAVPCDDLNEWAQWYIDNHADYILVDTLSNGMRVKTGFVGRDLDGQKIAFQTVIWNNTHRRILGRYNIKEESVDGHKKAVARARTFTDADFFALTE